MMEHLTTCPSCVKFLKDLSNLNQALAMPKGFDASPELASRLDDLVRGFRRDSNKSKAPDFSLLLPFRYIKELMKLKDDRILHKVEGGKDAYTLQGSASTRRFSIKPLRILLAGGLIAALVAAFLISGIFNPPSDTLIMQKAIAAMGQPGKITYYKIKGQLDEEPDDPAWQRGQSGEEPISWQDEFWVDYDKKTMKWIRHYRSRNGKEFTGKVLVRGESTLYVVKDGDKLHVGEVDIPKIYASRFSDPVSGYIKRYRELLKNEKAVILSEEIVDGVEAYRLKETLPKKANDGNDRSEVARLTGEIARIEGDIYGYILLPVIPTASKAILYEETTSYPGGMLPDNDGGDGGVMSSEIVSDIRKDNYQPLRITYQTWKVGPNQEREIIYKRTVTFEDFKLLDTQELTEDVFSLKVPENADSITRLNFSPAKAKKFKEFDLYYVGESFEGFKLGGFGYYKGWPEDRSGGPSDSTLQGAPDSKYVAGYNDPEHNTLSITNRPAFKPSFTKGTRPDLPPGAPGGWIEPTKTEITVGEKPAILYEEKTRYGERIDQVRPFIYRLFIDVGNSTIEITSGPSLSGPNKDIVIKAAESLVKIN
ncbi:MAG TPA: hypothetical protein VE439_01775 [Anaerolineae bacterium]|nr:hypothetical protein [Anaerolineae bacterium]